MFSFGFLFSFLVGTSEGCTPQQSLAIGAANNLRASTGTSRMGFEGHFTVQDLDLVYMEYVFIKQWSYLEYVLSHCMQGLSTDTSACCECPGLLSSVLCPPVLLSILLAPISKSSPSPPITCRKSWCGHSSAVQKSRGMPWRGSYRADTQA